MVLTSKTETQKALNQKFNYSEIFILSCLLFLKRQNLTLKIWFNSPKTNSPNSVILMQISPVSVQPTNDSGLRTLIYKNARVIVKFTKKDCPVCLRLWKHYLNLSQEPRFKDILFLMVDAAENPVSSKSVHLSGQPFFAIYYRSQLKECMLISEETVLEELLNRLLHF